MRKLYDKNYQYREHKYFYLYFLFYRNEIVYIGQCKELNNRLSSHRRKTKYCFDKNLVHPERNIESKTWSKYRFIKSKSLAQVKRWEQRLIKFYCPKYNIGHNCNTNIRRILSSKKINGKTAYYYKWNNKTIKPIFHIMNGRLVWSNYNPFTERVLYKTNKVYYVYDRNTPSYESQRISRIISYGKLNYLSQLGVRKGV